MKEIKTVPLGSVIGCNDKKFIVVGYKSNVVDNAYQLHYIAAPYPGGLCAPEQLKLIPVADAETLILGYQCKAFEVVEGFLNGLNQLYTAFSADEIDHALEQKAETETKERDETDE